MRDAAERPQFESDDLRPVRPFGFAAGLIGHNLDVATMSAVLLLGLIPLVAGLEVVRISPDWGFTYDGAVQGILSQLPTTGPAAVLVSAAVTANVLAGAVVLRLLSGTAFGTLSDLILGGFAASVVLDAATLFLLGSVGLFGWPELLTLHAAVAAAYLATRHRLPLMAAPVQFRVSRPGAWWLLILVVWAGPLVVQLASPAVPFSDVLPNHIAPAEHIRVFGSFSTLTTSPSPIYGSSRLMLGYVSLLGQLTTITNLDAVLAAPAFALPLTILVALAVRRLAGALFGGSASFWVLLTFPLTFMFNRIPDARDTVTVLPLAAWALCLVVAELRAADHWADADWDPVGDGVHKGRGGQRAPSIGLLFAIGAGFMVHAIIGLIAITAVVGVLILYPDRLARRLVPAIGGAVVVAIPQVLTMSGIDAPSWVGTVLIVAGIGTAFALTSAMDVIAARRTFWIGGEPFDSGGDRDRADWLRAALIGMVMVTLLVIARRLIHPSGNAYDPASELMNDFPYLVWLSLGGAALAILRLGRGWIVLGCGIAAGVAAWAAVGLVGVADLTQQAVHYEVPKSVEYWLPVMLAVGAAGAFAALYRLRWLGVLRPVAVVIFLVVAEYPTTQPLTTDIQIGEHRGSESLGLALREAELGYWYPYYPDARRIIDEPRQAVVDMLRSEEEKGRIGPATRVLHVAFSFQQWFSVPIGPFTGAMETSVSLSPERSIHTVGGRLLSFDQFRQELASGYDYIVLEPEGLWPDLMGELESLISQAGYRSVWSNSQATVYTR